MKSEKIQEKIEFLVQKWIDEADMQSILEYASDKLKEYYDTLSEDMVTELYEEEEK